MFGEVKSLKAPQEKSLRAEVISRILAEYPGRIFDSNEWFLSPPESSSATWRF
jgi:hypothetical protein